MAEQQRTGFAYEQTIYTVILMLFNTSAVSAPANSTAGAIVELEHRAPLEQRHQGELLALQVAAAQPQPPGTGDLHVPNVHATHTMSQRSPLSSATPALEGATQYPASVEK